MGVTSDRVALARDVAQLRDDGYLQREIAKVLEISPAYVSELTIDPDGSKARARKAGYRGTCEVCGKPTNGSNGREKAPKICGACSAAKQHDERHWTRERIVEAFRRYVAETGQRPISRDWLKAATHPGPDYPNVSTVQREFGSWNAGLEAAGIGTFPPGHYPRTAEVLTRYRAVWGGKHGHARDYGGVDVNTGLGRGQLAALRALDGASVSEHVRRAVDLYLSNMEGDER